MSDIWGCCKVWWPMLQGGCLAGAKAQLLEGGCRARGRVGSMRDSLEKWFFTMFEENVCYFMQPFKEQGTTMFQMINVMLSGFIIVFSEGEKRGLCPHQEELGGARQALPWPAPQFPRGAAVGGCWCRAVPLVWPSGLRQGQASDTTIRHMSKRSRK